MKRLGLQRRTGEKESHAHLGSFALKDKACHRAKEEGQFGFVANGQKDAQHAGIVISEDDSALIGKLDFVEFPEVIAETAQVARAGNEDAPMDAPPFAQNQLGEFLSGLKPHEIRGHRGHVRLQLARVKAAVLRIMLMEDLSQLGNGSAIEHGKNTSVVAVE